MPFPDLSPKKPKWYDHYYGYTVDPDNQEFRKGNSVVPFSSAKGQNLLKKYLNWLGNLADRSQSSFELSDRYDEIDRYMTFLKE